MQSQLHSTTKSASPVKTIVACLALCFAQTALAQNLNKPEDRISDSAINADYETYEMQQNEIKLLNDSGANRVASYSMAKAQCWLDVSFHEYTRNDRSSFPQEALTESARITNYLKRGLDPQASANPANETPLVNDAARLREDLWKQASELRAQPGASCVAQQIACAEVELVHAGNEHNQQQWRHAKPYVQLAEDMLGKARQGAQQCAVAKAAPAPVPAPVPVAVRELSLQANVLFNFDKYDIANARRLTVERLEQLIARINSGEFSVSAISLVGHADRSNKTGEADYNLRLSQRRVNTVREYLIRSGISSDLISVDARADNQQVEPCRDAGMSRAETIECLLPNRRVEVVVTATSEAK